MRAASALAVNSIGLVLLGACMVITVLATVYLLAVIMPKYWTGQWRNREDRLQMTAPARYTEAARAGLKRTGAALSIGAVGLSITAIGLFAAAASAARSGSVALREAIPPWAYIGFVGGMAAGGLLRYTIVRWNRPRLLVPPHHRGEPGAGKVHIKRTGER